jgi:hypothetical protein
MEAAQDVELCDCFLEYGEATAEMLLLLTFVALGTTLIWTGLDVIHWRTLLFAGIALTVRTIVLYPVLGGLGLNPRDRRLIALLGPRGLSTLLLTLLPVFAGVAGAERLFAISCLVVLISVVGHGGLIAYLLRAEPMAPASAAPQSRADAMGLVPVTQQAPQALEEERPGITLEELAALKVRGEPTVIVDSRTDKSRDSETLTAAGALRVHPDDPVRDALALGIPRDATITVYCS